MSSKETEISSWNFESKLIQDILFKKGYKGLSEHTSNRDKVRDHIIGQFFYFKT